MEDIEGQEVSLFMHCHLRGYDKTGEGISEDRSHLDQYGAPLLTEDSWVEGYHQIEKQLAETHKKLLKNRMKFPPIVGLGGTAHLYKEIHANEPWNWTGWIPLQKQFYHKNKYINYRNFIGIRGNEIQNNLWDYPPTLEEEEGDDEFLLMTDLADEYKGGYWFEGNAFGRYLHIIALKSHNGDCTNQKCRRYNYIVHPLAYRSAFDTIPDNSVDAMQWCINNMPEEEHFGNEKPWGEKCHGLEIFNDFTYFYSYQPIEEGGPNNGELATNNKHKDYYYWFDTYALEFAEFLLNSGLARGSYFHTLTANDAFYERNVFEDRYDPKSSLYKYIIMKKSRGHKVSALGLKKADQEKEREKTLSSFVRALAYKERTVLGFVTLFDPQCCIKNTVESDIMNLDKAGDMVLCYLAMGRFYSSTGIHDLFNYDIRHPSHPPLLYTINDQPDTKEMCYDIDELEMKFTFWPVKEENTDLVWRYTIMLETVNSENKQALETIHGYFKLDKEGQTILDLTSYEKSQVKWLYFTAIRPRNPQHRAWFNAIRGPAFGDPKPDEELLLEHHVEVTQRVGKVVIPKERITPTPVKADDLDFLLQGTPKNKHDIYVYSMQVCPHQQNLTQEPVNEKIRKSSDLIPPRILQSVHGYFNLRKKYPTRLNLCASWDSTTLKDREVLFYVVDGETGDPQPIPEEAKIIQYD